MGLADALETLQPKAWQVCGVSAVLETLADDDRAALLDALGNGAYRSSDITRALQDEGHEIGYDAVSRHRRGACKCPR